MAKHDQIGFNDREQLDSIRGFLLPSWSELAFLLVSSLIIVLVFNYRVIWGVITNTANVSPTTINDIFRPQLNYLDTLLQNNLFGQLAVWLVWGLIGSVIYMIIWAVEHFYLQVKDDVQGEGYVRSSSSMRQYWRSRASQYLLFFCASFVFLLALTFFLIVFLPFGTGLADTVLRYGSLRTLHYGFVAVFIIAFGLWVMIRVWRIAAYAYRITFDPLPE